MKAFLILEDGTVFTGTSIGSTRDMISEIVFNTSMTGYLEVLTDPSYAGQAVVMTYPLIGNYGITPDMESLKAWPDGYIVRELSRMPSNFRCEGTIQDFLKKYDIPGIAGVDTRALTKILREKGTMNGMITTNENYDLEEVISKLKNYKVEGVVSKVTCEEKYVLEGTGKKVALLDLGAKKNIAKSLNDVYSLSSQILEYLMLLSVFGVDLTFKYQVSEKYLKYIFINSQATVFPTERTSFSDICVAGFPTGGF